MPIFRTTRSASRGIATAALPDRDRAAAGRSPERRDATRCQAVGLRAMARLSIVMPVLDEGEAIAAALDALADLRALGVEVIVVDGGSQDATVQRARLRADHVLSAPRGRAL